MKLGQNFRREWKVGLGLRDLMWRGGGGECVCVCVGVCVCVERQM